MFQLEPGQQSEVIKALDSLSGEAYGYLPAMIVRGADRAGTISRESNASGATFDSQGFVTGADLISGRRAPRGPR